MNSTFFELTELVEKIKIKLDTMSPGSQADELGEIGLHGMLYLTMIEKGQDLSLEEQEQYFAVFDENVQTYLHLSRDFLKTLD